MGIPLSLSIATAYLFVRKRQTLISVFGVAMGVGFFIAVLSMMQGFQSYFIAQVLDVSPHVIMKDEFRSAPQQPVYSAYPHAVIQLDGLKPKDEQRGILGGDRIVREIAKIPGVNVSASLRGQVLLHYGGKDLAATLVGIVPHMEVKTSNIEKDMTEGSLFDLMTNRNGVLLGDGIAKNLGARLGSKISVVSPEGVTLIMKVEGIMRTGITEVDYTQVYALLEKSQILQKRDNRINLIKMRLADINQSAELAERLEARYTYRTEGWEETNENIFGLFRMQNIILYSVVTAILIVAGFGIFNIITTVVNEKVKDIAILKSMGFGKRDIEFIFLWQGLMVGMMGAVTGWILGYVLMGAMEKIPMNIGKEGFLATDHMIIYRSYSHYAISGVLAIISASLAALLPARKAAALNPVDIIRGAT
jgi:lipoprotein-releasing system permease protein